MKLSTELTVWIAAILIVAVYSYLYKDNFAFGLTEHLFIGVMTGHTLATGYSSFVNLVLKPLNAGKAVVIVPLLLGLGIYTRFFPRYSSISKVCLSVPLGIGAGVALRGIPSAQILGQIKAAMVPLTSLNAVITVLGVLGVLAFFFFTTLNTGVISHVGRIGRWLMMVSFGATFASGFSGRVAISIGNFQMILKDWLGLIR